MLTLRCRKILKKLSSLSSPVKIKELMHEFKVSERTIKYDLEVIRDWLAQNNSIAIQIINYPRQGICLSGNLNKMDDLLLKLDDENDCLNLHPKERIKYIALELLTSNEFVTLRTLANHTQVSKNTVLIDLVEVTKFLNTWNIELERKVHWGFRVITTEIKRRLVIEYLILMLFDNSEIALLLQNFNEKQLPASIDRILCRFLIQKDDVEFIYHAFQQIIFYTSHDRIGLLRDRVSVGFLVRLCVSMNRLCQSDTLESEILNTAGDISSQAIEKVIMVVFQKKGITISSQEINFLITPFLSERLSDTKLDLSGIVTKIIQKVTDLSTISFIADCELYENLLAHMKERIARHRYSVIDPNPLLGGIMNYYGDLFQLVRQVAYDVLGSINILLHDEDIAYLVLHFQASYERRFGKQRFRVLVVCSTGRGSAKLLKAQLENEFNELHIIGCCPVLELEEALKWQPVDLIISVLPIKVDIPCIVVNALLNKQNIMDIQKVLNGFKMVDKVKPFYPAEMWASIKVDKSLAYVTENHEELPKLEILSQEIISKGFQIGLLICEEFRIYLNRQAETGLMLHCLLMANRMAFRSLYVDFSRNKKANTPAMEQTRRRVKEIIGQYYSTVSESEIHAILNYFDFKVKGE